MSGWVNVAGLIDTRDVPLFVQTFEQRVSGSDATYWLEDHLLIDLPSIDDEVWFRLAFMDETTLREMQRFGHRGYLVPPRHQADLEGWIVQGLFEAIALPLTIVRAELRNDDVLRRFEDGLAAAEHSFTGGRPDVWRV